MLFVHIIVPIGLFQIPDSALVRGGQASHKRDLHLHLPAARPTKTAFHIPQAQLLSIEASWPAHSRHKAHHHQQQHRCHTQERNNPIPEPQMRISERKERDTAAVAGVPTLVAAGTPRRR